MLLKWTLSVQHLRTYFLQGSSLGTQQKSWECQPFICFLCWLLSKGGAGLWIRFNVTSAVLSHNHCDCPLRNPAPFFFLSHSCLINHRQTELFSEILTTRHWYQGCIWLLVKPSTFQLGWNHFHTDMYMCLLSRPSCCLGPHSGQ